jgi:hypothetical protein
MGLANARSPGRKLPLTGQTVSRQYSTTKSSKKRHERHGPRFLISRPETQLDSPLNEQLHVPLYMFRAKIARTTPSRSASNPAGAGLSAKMSSVARSLATGSPPSATHQR